MAGSGLFHVGIGLAALAWLASELPTVEPASAPVAPVAGPAAPTPTLAIGNVLSSAILQRAPDGKFYAEASVNGTPVRLLVDTGATGVVLTADDARRAGLGSGDFTAEGRGAGGVVRLRPVTLQRLVVGPLVSDTVPAMVAEEGRLPVSLLGQAWLSRVASVTIAGDRMVLR